MTGCPGAPWYVYGLAFVGFLGLVFLVTILYVWTAETWDRWRG